MEYDPQRYRRRPKPSGDGPAPIETMLDADPTPSSPGEPTAASHAGVGARQATSLGNGMGPTSANPVPDDPPPDPSVTPQPADPWSDKLLFGVSVSTIVGVMVALLVFRWLWVRSRRAGSTSEAD